MRRFSALIALAGLLAAQPAHAWVAQKVASAAVSSQVMMAIGSVTNSGDRFQPVNYSHSATSATYLDMTVVAAPGVISSLRAAPTSAITGAITVDVTLYKNGSATAMTCQLALAAQTCSDNTHTVSVAAGDGLAMLYHTVGSIGTNPVSTSTLFTPTTTGDTLLSSWGTAFSTGSTQNLAISTGAIAISTTGSTFPDSGTVSKLYIISNAPGAAASGKKYDYTVRLNGSNQTTTCSVLEIATTCNDTTHSVSITGASGNTAGSNISFAVAPTSTPTAAVAGFGVNYRPNTASSFAVVGAQGSATDSTSADTWYPISMGSNGLSTASETNQKQISNSMTITTFTVKTNGTMGAAASGKQRDYFIRKNGVDTAATCSIVETQSACTWTGTLSIADGDMLSIRNHPTATPNATTSETSILATR